MTKSKAAMAAMAASLALNGCGGGSGGGAPISTAPTPTPTPPPTPTPTPNAATSYRVVLGDGLIGNATFDVNADGTFGNTTREGVADVYDYSNRTGDFGRDVTGRINTSGQSPATANAAIQVVAIDPVTGFYYSDLRVASGVTVVSPTTSLLRFVDDDTVATNTGVGLSARQLAAFDYPRRFASQDANERAIARRIQALDLKLIAYAFIGNGIGAPSDSGIAVRAGLTPVAERFAQGAVDLNEPAQAEAILSRLGDLSRATAEQRSAIAQLLARYGQAVDAYLTQGGTVARIQYGLRLSILPEIARVLRGNSVSPARIAAFTVSDIVAEFERYVDIPPQHASPGLFATPDVRTIYRLSLDPIVLSTCGGETGAPTCNDLSVTNTIGQQEGTQIDFASVPNQFTGTVSLSLEGPNRLVIRRLTSERRTIWIDYTARSPAGQSSSRLYLRLNEE